MKRPTVSPSAATAAATSGRIALSRLAGELGHAAQDAIAIEVVLCELVEQSADISHTAIGELQRLDRLRQTLENLAVFAARLASDDRPEGPCTTTAAQDLTLADVAARLKGVTLMESQGEGDDVLF